MNNIADLQVIVTKIKEYNFCDTTTGNDAKQVILAVINDHIKTVRERKVKSIFEMYRAVKNHYNENKDRIVRGCLTEPEISVIKKEFGLETASLVELNNVRDFVVAAASSREPHGTPTETEQIEYARRWDMMSAITHLIDTFKMKLGDEV